MCLVRNILSYVKDSICLDSMTVVTGCIETHRAPVEQGILTHQWVGATRFSKAQPTPNIIWGHFQQFLGLPPEIPRTCTLQTYPQVRGQNTLRPKLGKCRENVTAIFTFKKYITTCLFEFEGIINRIHVKVRADPENVKGGEGPGKLLKVFNNSRRKSADFTHF